MPGWITTPSLADGGTGHDQLSIVTAQVGDAQITAAKLVAGAATVAYYGWGVYGTATYG